MRLSTGWIHFFSCLCFCLAQVYLPSSLVAQHDHDEEKANTQRSVDKDRSSLQEDGLSSNSPDVFAIVGATVHRNPTATPAVETILIKGTKIIAIGDVKIPAGTQTVDAKGKHVYPGLIDAYHGQAFDFDASKNGTAYWLSLIHISEPTRPY